MLTRRQFLVGAATTLAAAATGCRLRLPGLGSETPPPAEPIAGPRPFRIALLSDTHCQDAASLGVGPSNGKLVRAVADFQLFAPDLWICNGDVADHGLPGEFAAFKKIVGTAAKPEQILTTTGNHEFYDMTTTDDVELNRFRKAFGQAQPYSNRVVSGIHIVMLADEQYHTAPKNPDWAWLTPGQLRWFEQVLTEHREKFTVVCLHQPLQETVLWSLGNNNFGGCGQAAELRAILKQHPQVKLWFSGHTHQLVEAPGQTVKQGEVTFAALGSTFYLFRPSDAPEDQGGWPAPGGFKKDLGASESRMLEVFPDHVLLRSRDHVRQAWIEGQDLVIPTTQV